MKIYRFQITFLSLGLLLLPAGTSHALPAKGDMKSRVVLPAAGGKVGQNVPLKVITTNKSALSGVVMVAVFDAKDKRVAGKDWQNVTLIKGKPGTYTWNWKPGAKGVYTVRSAVFGPKWHPTYFWDWRGSKLTVK